MTADGIEEVLGASGAGPEDPFGSGDLAAAQYKPFSFTAKRLILAALVDKAISVVPTREMGDNSVLKDFLVQVGPGKLQMAATDLELAVLATTPAVTADADETLVLPARKLLAILRESPADDITIAVDGEFATVRAGTASWTLQLHDCSVYPPLPDPAEVDMHAVGREGFLRSLKTVRHAVGRDSGRPALQQVDISVRESSQPRHGGDGEVTVTACDGTRFARTRLAGFPLAMQIPAGALDSLVKTLESSELDEVQVGETASHLVFRVSGTVFLASKLMTKFPDVDKLLLRPALENRLRLAVDKAALAGAIRRVRINADPDTSAIGMQLRRENDQGELTVVARDKYGNRAQEAIAATWEHADRLVVVNHQFLTEMLAAYPAQTCQFLLAAETGRKRSVLMIKDEETGTVGVVYQMLASLVGYGELQVATGVITRFNDAKGWGFIKPDGGGPDVMLHVRELLPGEDAAWLKQGTRVSYDERSGPRGVRAANVQVEDAPGEAYGDVLSAAQFRNEVAEIVASAIDALEKAARRHGWIG
jgi:cold shock protein